MRKQDPSIRFERLDRENCNDLPVLYHAVYGRKIDPSYFKKKYGATCNGIEYLGYLAYSEGLIPVAFIGAVPRDLFYEGTRVFAAQLTDGMTDPGCRGKGLFVQLVEAVTQLCKQNQLHFLFGFPNQHSLPVFLDRLGWDVYGKMDHFNLPVKTLPLEKISRKLPLLKKIYGVYVNTLLRKYMKGPAMDSGTFLISIRHAVILIKISNGLSVGEMSVSKNEFADVMHTLQNIAKKLGLTKICFHCSTNSELHGLFADNYASVPSFTIISKDLALGIPVDSIKFSYADIDIF